MTEDIKKKQQRNLRVILNEAYQDFPEVAIALEQYITAGGCTLKDIRLIFNKKQYFLHMSKKSI